MPRRPRPPHLRLLTSRNSRDRRPEPTATGPYPPPTPPDFLGPEALAEWQRVVAHLAAGPFDQALLAAYAQAYGRWAASERLIAELPDLTIETKRGGRGVHPLVQVSRRAAADFGRLAAELKNRIKLPSDAFFEVD